MVRIMTATWKTLKGAESLDLFFCCQSSHLRHAARFAAAEAAAAAAAAAKGAESLDSFFCCQSSHLRHAARFAAAAAAAAAATNARLPPVVPALFLLGYRDVSTGHLAHVGGPASVGGHDSGKRG